MWKQQVQPHNCYWFVTEEGFSSPLCPPVSLVISSTVCLCTKITSSLLREHSLKRDALFPSSLAPFIFKLPVLMSPIAEKQGVKQNRVNKAGKRRCNYLTHSSKTFHPLRRHINSIIKILLCELQHPVELLSVVQNHEDLPSEGDNMSQVWRFTAQRNQFDWRH